LTTTFVAAVRQLLRSLDSRTARLPSPQAWSEYGPNSSELSAVTLPVRDDPWPGPRRGTERRPAGSRAPVLALIK
jgi:hypothetical protein